MSLAFVSSSPISWLHKICPIRKATTQHSCRSKKCCGSRLVPLCTQSEQPILVQVSPNTKKTSTTDNLTRQLLFSSLQNSEGKDAVKMGLKKESLGTLPFWALGAAFIIGWRVYTKIKVKEQQQEETEQAQVSEFESIPEEKTILEEEQDENSLHVFKCAKCGYSLFPAKGREFKFFTDNFKCPACGSTKEVFYDTSDPNDPRNRLDDEEEEEEIEETS
eukprot:jgi/Galph1/5060/GphlegSOOS_G3717.1